MLAPDPHLLPEPEWNALVTRPAPTAERGTPYGDGNSHWFIAFTQELTETDLDTPLEYANMNGVAQRKNLHAVLMHFFNHQTHHRGQVSTLLFQAGVDVGMTDLLALIPDMATPT